jgi:hypothetical protein
MIDHAKLDACLAKADALGTGNSANRGSVEVTLRVSNTDFLPRLIRFFQICKSVAAGGHSFEVEADRDDHSYKEPPRFGIDGDGADRIFEVLVNGKKAPDVPHREFRK